MNLPLPNLSTLTYEDLRKESIATIPKYTDKWTNFNPSDPGITIIELLCWIAELTLYRINLIPDETYHSFLKLVSGICNSTPEILLKELQSNTKRAEIDMNHVRLLEFMCDMNKRVLENKGWKPDKAEIKSAAITFMQSRYRAVTEEDFIALAIESTESEYWTKKHSVTANGIETCPKVRRASVEAIPEEGKAIVYLVAQDGNKEGDSELLAWVADYLKARKLIGTRIEVRMESFTDVTLNIKIVCEEGSIPKLVEEEVSKTVTSFLDPIVGGENGTGWVIGRPLTFYELAAVIESVQGVKRTDSITLPYKQALTKIEIVRLVKLKKITVTSISKD